MTNATIRHYYEHCPYFGAWPEDAADVLTTRAGSQSAGEVMQLQVKVRNGKISDVRIQIYGCGYAIAALAYVAEYCMGKRLSELIISAQEIADALQLPARKLHSTLVVESLLAQLTPPAL